MALPHIDLVPLRQEDLQDRYPDYLVYAAERLVGRIYCQVGGIGRTEQWFWGVQGVFTSMEIGPLHGLAPSFDHAKVQLRTAFDLWLAWALAAPSSHLSYARIQQDLQEVGALSASA
jgi:hypothetical protein